MKMEKFHPSLCLNRAWGLVALAALILFVVPSSARTGSFIAIFESDPSEHKWSIKILNPDLPTDWSPFGYLTFDINASSTQRFFLNLYDADGLRRLKIQPFQGAWVRASIPLTYFQHRNVIGHDMAAIGKTPLPGLWIGFTAAVGPINKVDSLGMEMVRPIGQPTVEIRNVRLTMEPEDAVLGPVPVVDEFGQWIPADWFGKAKTLNDLKTDWDRETRELQPRNYYLSKYGGYLGDRVEATGFFRVEKTDGRWWFVDPEGYFFFSLGSTGIYPKGSFSRVEGRENLFVALPPDELTRSDKGIGRHSIYDWNLYRRFGTDWYQKWMDNTIRRMDDWGLNTIANWSDINLGRSGRKPYVATLKGWRFNASTMGMPDVYAPDYPAFVDAAAEEQCAPLRDDPYLIGYFIGNEPPWPGREQELARVILEGETTPMQNALKKYLAEGDTPERRRDFAYATYNKFVTMVNEAIKKHDPNHLNLGFRFGGSPPEDIIGASGGFDVFSINIYDYFVNPNLLQKIDDLTGLPVVLGEFHFGVPERGLAPGLSQTISQEERGVAYRYYVESAAAHPSIIGTHWFQWWDQPPTGRYDGENYNIGFVDVTDRPYRALIDAARETHKRIYDIHSGRTQPVSRQAVTH